MIFRYILYLYHTLLDAIWHPTSQTSKNAPPPLALSGGALIWGNAQQLQLHQGPLMWFPVVQDRFTKKNHQRCMVWMVCLKNTAKTRPKGEKKTCLQEKAGKTPGPKEKQIWKERLQVKSWCFFSGTETWNGLGRVFRREPSSGQAYLGTQIWRYNPGQAFGYN